MSDPLHPETRGAISPKQTIPEQIEQLQGRAKWWQEHSQALEERIEELEGKRTDTDRAKREKLERRERAAEAELASARAAAIRALVKLLPQAIEQAKGSPARKGHAAKPPRPALLRLILRATR